MRCMLRGIWQKICKNKKRKEIKNLLCRKKNCTADFLCKSDAGLNFEAPEILLVTPVPVHSVGRTEDLDQMHPNMEERSQALASYYEQIAVRQKIHYMNPAGLVEVNETDGIHYTEKGHAQMAELMENKIREIFA